MNATFGIDASCKTPLGFDCPRSNPANQGARSTATLAFGVQRLWRWGNTRGREHPRDGELNRSRFQVLVEKGPGGVGGLFSVFARETVAQALEDHQLMMGTDRLHLFVQGDRLLKGH